MNENIVLGVDLDEVVFRYIDFLRIWLKTEKGIIVPDGQPSTWSLKDSGWFESEEEFRNTHGLAVDSGLYEHLELVPGAKKTLRELSKSGYEINIITSRFVNPGQHQKVVSQTVKALDENWIPYNALSFMSNKLRLFADAYIDDSPTNIERLSENNRFVIAFNTKYNEKIDSPARATNWDEVRQILFDKFGR